MKKRRWAALVLCLLLVLRTVVPVASAAENVYFVAAGGNVLPLSDSTMPFWNNGYLYIPASIFTGSIRQYFGITYNYNPSSQTAILYNGMGDHSLIFYLNESYTLDRDGNISYPGGLLRNGIPYVPAYLVARYFNLSYSVLEVKHGYLVWLRLPGFGLPEQDFVNAAAYPMATRYNDYVKSKETQPLPEQPAVSSEGVEISGKVAYLCLKADGNTSAMLDALDRYDAQAAFFCAPDFLENQGGLLRRMTATGHSIGILADAADSAHTVPEQLEAGRRALERATCGGTRLVMVQNGNDEVLQEARAAGYHCLQPDLDRSKYELKSSSNATSLLKKLSASRNSTIVWLADSATPAGLRTFLSAIEDADGRCLALTETS